MPSILRRDGRAGNQAPAHSVEVSRLPSAVVVVVVLVVSRLPSAVAVVVVVLVVSRLPSATIDQDLYN